MSIGGREVGKPFFPETCRELRFAATQNRRRKLQVIRKREDTKRRKRPVQSFTGKKEPATDQNQEHGNFRETAPEIVHDLPTRNQIDRIANNVAKIVRNAREEPEENLPVPAHPAVFAPAVCSHS